MADFSVLKSRVSKHLGLDETASGQDDTVLGYELNDAVRDFLLRTKLKVKRASIPITATLDDVDSSALILSLLDLQVTGSDAQIWLPERTSPAEILRMRRGEAGSGTARYYALNGVNMLMFYPALVNGDTVTLYYVPKPTEMSSGSHDPSSDTYGGVPSEYHPALIEYAKWKMADYDDDNTSRMGTVYQAEYERLVRQALKNKREQGGRRLGRAIVGRQPVRPSSPSQDIW